MHRVFGRKSDGAPQRCVHTFPDSLWRRKSDLSEPRNPVSARYPVTMYSLSFRYSGRSFQWKRSRLDRRGLPALRLALPRGRLGTSKSSAAAPSPFCEALILPAPRPRRRAQDLRSALQLTTCLHSAQHTHRPEGRGRERPAKQMCRRARVSTISAVATWRRVLSTGASQQCPPSHVARCTSLRHAKRAVTAIEYAGDLDLRNSSHSCARASRRLDSAEQRLCTRARAVLAAAVTARRRARL